MSMVRRGISTFFSLNGPILKNSIFKDSLLHKVSKTKCFDQLPLVSAGPHVDEPRQLFMLNLKREVSCVPQGAVKMPILG